MSGTSVDVGPLSWVKGEIEAAFTRAGEAAAEFAANPGNGEALQAAQTHLHQAHGALSIVGLDGLTQISAGLEALLADMTAGKVAQPAEAAHLFGRALGVLRRYLDELSRGMPNKPLRLLALYEELARARGAEGVSPVDLFYPDLSLRPPARSRETPALTTAQLQQLVRSERGRFERGLLAWFKGTADGAGLADMRAAVTAIEASQTLPTARAFWWASMALLDALIAHGLPADNALKRLCGSINQQLRRLLEGSRTIPERLMREVLYQLAVATDGGAHLALVRSTYHLTDLLADADEALAEAPPADDLDDLRQILLAAEDAWHGHCSGTENELPHFAGHMATLLERSRDRLSPELGELIARLHHLAQRLQADPQALSEALAMEVATSLLVVENALLNYTQFEQSDVAPRQVRFALRRLEALSQGESLATIAVQERDEVSRQAQEKLAMSQVVKEMHHNLAHVEEVLDNFFRDPSHRDELAGLETPIRQVHGALSMLGQRQAAEVLEQSEAVIQRLATSSAPPSHDDFTALAQQLSSLGFYLDALLHGEPDFDETVTPLKAKAPVVFETVIEPIPDHDPTLAAAGEDGAPAPVFEDPLAALRASLATMTGEAAQPAAPIEKMVAAAVPTAEADEEPEDVVAIEVRADNVEIIRPDTTAPSKAGSAAEVVDQDMLPIFLDEAHDVLSTIDSHLHTLRDRPDDRSALTTVRRGFHTLKGSSRMVGLKAYGEAAWTVEQALNKWLQTSHGATPAVIRLAADGRDLLQRWIVQIARGDEGGIDTAGLVQLADGLTRDAGTEEIVDVVFETRAPAPPLTAPPPADAVETVQAAPLDPFAFAAPPLVTEAEAVGEHAAAPAGDGLMPTAPAPEPTAEAPAPMTDAATAPQALEPADALMAAPGSMPPAGEIATAEPAEAADEVPELGESQVVPPEAMAEAAATPAGGIDPELLPIFLEEAGGLVRDIGNALRAWKATPQTAEAANNVARLLHTLKGSARTAGAIKLGAQVHLIEAKIEAHVPASVPETQAFIEGLERSFDKVALGVDALAAGATPATAPEAPAPMEAREADAGQVLRVRTELVDRLVNEAGELSIARARIEGELRTLKLSLAELTENVARLRHQLREVEIQSETQMASRMAQAEAQHTEFDPLEKDRFTRLQELTRMLAESVNDVATVQHNLLRNLHASEAAISAQSRINRELSQGLMSMRMLPLAAISDRLHRTVRQAADEVGRRIDLQFDGEDVELDRSVLERMTAPLEHLLRNAVSHGIEAEANRVQAGKPAAGRITLCAVQEANEIALSLADDGRGLDFARIRARAVELGLLGTAEIASEARLTEFIFAPGFSTAASVSQIAGRGVGMDVVRNEVAALGGRIDVSSQPGQGVRFRIYLPLTLAVTRALLVKVDGKAYAVPSVMVEQVQELKPAQMAQVRGNGRAEWLGNRFPFATLASLLGEAETPGAALQRHWLLLLRSGENRIALQVDEVAGNEEIVVKSLGPQLSRVLGFSGATVLADGEIVLILNPAALLARARSLAHAPNVSLPPAPPATPPRPTVMVVDDSLTVRKITGRLLEREGYRVLTAKDGVDAVEKMTETVPDVMLVDIEMPRMDGFDLTRHVRADERLKHVPIIMITSRLADKHRAYAAEIGVNYYLGKPYQDSELLERIGSFVNRPLAASPA